VNGSHADCVSTFYTVAFMMLPAAAFDNTIVGFGVPADICCFYHYSYCGKYHLHLCLARNMYLFDQIGMYIFVHVFVHGCCGVFFFGSGCCLNML